MSTKTKKTTIFSLVSALLFIIVVLALNGCEKQLSGSSAGSDTSGNNPDNPSDTSSVDTADSSDTSKMNSTDPGGSITVGDINVIPGSIMGPSGDKPYAPDVNNSEAVDIDENGWLILSDLSDDRTDLWIANAGDSTISRINTNTVEEIGRYHVGVGGSSNPSRTTVDLAGDMFVGNRNNQSVTKIASNTTRCIDRNNNGTIETSTGPTDIYPRAVADDPNGVSVGESTDECVLWTRVIDGDKPCDGPRGMAATAETGLDFEYNGHVWVGCQVSQYIYKLNGKTGETLEVHGPFDGVSETEIVAPYGFVLDNKHHLWISSFGRNVYMFDIETKVMHNLGGPSPYGIAIDHFGNIWAAQYNGGNIHKYTPGEGDDIANGTWESLQTEASGLRGIAVDENNLVYAVETHDAPANIHIVYNPATFPDLSSYTALGLDTANNGARGGTGVALDFKGNLWGVSMSGCEDGNGCAFKFDVTRTKTGIISITGKSKVVPVGKNAYSYSDMTGYSLRNFATDEGWYRQTFNVCENQSTRWQQLGFNSDLPANTDIVIRARTADFEKDIEDAQFVTVVTVPGDETPVDLPVALPEGRFIQLEVHLYKDGLGKSPSVGDIGFTFTCTDDIVIE